MLSIKSEADETHQQNDSTDSPFFTSPNCYELVSVVTEFATEETQTHRNDSEIIIKTIDLELHRYQLKEEFEQFADLSRKRVHWIEKHDEQTFCLLKQSSTFTVSDVVMNVNLIEPGDDEEDGAEDVVLNAKIKDEIEEDESSIESTYKEPFYTSPNCYELLSIVTDFTSEKTETIHNGEEIIEITTTLESHNYRLKDEFEMFEKLPLTFIHLVEKCDRRTFRLLKHTTSFMVLKMEDEREQLERADTKMMAVDSGVDELIDELIDSDNIDDLNLFDDFPDPQEDQSMFDAIDTDDEDDQAVSYKRPSEPNKQKIPNPLPQQPQQQPKRKRGRPPKTTPTVFKKYTKNHVTGYILFESDIRRFVVEANPDCSFADISRLIYAQWKLLGKKEKLEYEYRAEEENAQMNEIAAAEAPPAVPEVINGVYECHWEAECDYQFEDVDDLCEHLTAEPNGHVWASYASTKNKNLGQFKCMFRDCSRVQKGFPPYPSIDRLIRHCKNVHIQKAVLKPVEPEQRSKNFVKSKKKAAEQKAAALLQQQQQVNIAIDNDDGVDGFDSVNIENDFIDDRDAELDTRADKLVIDRIDTDDEDNWTEVSDCESDKENIRQKSVQQNPQNQGQKRKLTSKSVSSLCAHKNRMNHDMAAESDEDDYPVSYAKASQQKKLKLSNPSQQPQMLTKIPEGYACHHIGCSFVAPMLWRLKRHLSTHLETKPFECKGCGFSSTQHDHVLRHIEQQHNQVRRDAYKWLKINENFQQDTKSTPVSTVSLLPKRFQSQDFENNHFCRSSEVDNLIDLADINSDELVDDLSADLNIPENKAKFKPNVSARTNNDSDDSFDANFEADEDDDDSDNYYPKSAKVHKQIRQQSSSRILPRQKPGKQHELFVCDHDGCDFVTFQGWRMRNHSLKHLEIKPFGCACCRFASRQRHYVLRHIQEQHNKDKHDAHRWLRIDANFQDKKISPISAVSLFSSKALIKNHEKTNIATERFYRCKWTGCLGYSSFTKDTVARHVRSHHFGITQTQFRMAKKRGQILGPRDINEYIGTDVAMA